METPNITFAQASLLIKFVEEFETTNKYGMRLPTLLWMISDLLGVVDFEARLIVTRLVDRGWLRIEQGWVKV